MGQEMDRQELSSKLKRAIDKTASKISTKVEAEKGDFKIEITKSAIEKYYKGKLIESQAATDLDDDLHEIIQDSPQEAAYEILNNFKENYKVEANRSASTDTETIQKDAKEESNTVQKEADQKEAAHRVIDKETAEVVTQKQMDKNLDIHPRTDYNPDKITQSQLSEDGEQGRAGTYDVITQSQLNNEKSTFYNEPLVAAERKGEDRNTVTEDQFDSEEGKNDRGNVSVKYDGGLDTQDSVVGTKQLAELLSHHSYNTPLAITEDQLKDQDGELARLTAEIAGKIIKEAITTIGKTSLACGSRPEKVVDVVRQLVSHESKIVPFADTIRRFAKSSIKSIEDKVADCKWGGKTANINLKPSNNLIADVLTRQLAKLSYNPLWIVKGLKNLINDPSLTKKIAKVTDEILEQPNINVKKAGSEDDVVFQEILSGKTADAKQDRTEGSAENDGLYQYRGKLEEVKADVKNKEVFMKKAAEHSKNKVLANINEDISLIPQNISVDEDKGEFTLTLKDASFIDKNIQSRAESRRAMAKEAQVPAGGMGAGPDMGGMANPAPPPGAADMAGQPPAEALGADPMAANNEDPENGGEAKPPGSVCPTCGSEDVDVDNGEFKCNGCGSEGTIHVKIEVNKWPDTITETDSEEGGGFEIGDEAAAGLESGEEELAGGGTTLPNVPVGASVKITPFVIEKLASQNIKFASVCPSCGSHNTHRMKSASRKGDDCICWECMTEYSFRVVANKNKKHNVYAQYIWMPNTEDKECSTCSKLKVAFVNSLKNYGMSWNQFDSLPSIKEKADVIIKMSSNETLDIRKAMNDPIQVEKYAASSRWNGYDKFDKFPLTSCKERISRRFGENATAMSGPCQGKSLPDCVCAQLDDLGIYTDGLAAKVASRHVDTDPMLNSPTETCVAMFVRDGYTVKNACTACDALKAAYATVEDLIVETVQSHEVKEAQILGQDDDVPEEVEHDVDIDVSDDGPGVSIEESIEDPSVEESPVEESPVEEVLVEESPVEEVSDMDFDMENNLGDMDMGEDYVTVKIPMDDIAKALQQAMHGNISEDMIDVTGDDLEEENISDDTLEPTEDATEDLGENMGVEEDNADEIPGLDEESTEDNGVLTKEGPFKEEEEEEENKECSAPMMSEDEEGSSPMPMEEDKGCSSPMPDVNKDESKKCKPCSSPMKKEKPMESNEVESTASNKSVTKEASADQLEEMLIHMKQGSIAKESSSLDFLIDSLNKTAAKNDDIKKTEYTTAKENKIKDTPAQDTSDIGKYKDGGTQGDEDKFTNGVSDGPDVPRSDGLLGKEESDKKIDEKGDRPSIPVGDNMKSEEKSHKENKPEKQDEIDPNQGADAKASAENKVKKTADKDQDDEDKEAKDENSGECNHNPKKSCFKCKAPCYKCCGCNNKKASTKKYKVTKSHKLYDTFKTKLANNKQVKLEDGNHYDVVAGKKDILFLVQSKNNEELKKESDTKTVNRVKSLEDDSDLKAGYDISNDQTHSLAVDEKRPSEGVKDPDVPEAPNGGRLLREKSVDKATDLPEIPAGGGMTSGKDENEKNTPEKQEETLGTDKGPASTASNNRDRAVKIAGRMLKQNKISIDDLTAKIDELSQASSAILDDYDSMFGEKKVAENNAKKGLQKEANAETIETEIPVTSVESATKKEAPLAEKIASLTRLSKQNREWESFLAEKEEN